jgi:hypothetical protein
VDRIAEFLAEDFGELLAATATKPAKPPARAPEREPSPLPVTPRPPAAGGLNGTGHVAGVARAGSAGRETEKGAAPDGDEG